MMNGLAYGGAAVLASSLDMRIGCEHASFRFLAAAYGRINSTWTLPNQVGWPIAKELLFSARVVEAEEAHRIGLLNHLVPCARAARQDHVAGDDDRQEPARGGHGREGAAAAQTWARRSRSSGRTSASYTTNVMRGAKAESGLPGVHRPQGPAAAARGLMVRYTAPARPAPTIQQRSTT